ncbi:hypothetical protein [Enhygromyxa salina]|nr:hypothetical protein [Enhygromyxa salina]
MTVLVPPRIYFRGGTSWDVATGNHWPTYDSAVAELNWAYLATQTVDGVAITPENYRELFPKWVLTPQTHTEGATSWRQPPSEWNYYGANSSQFIQSKTGGTTTTVTAGQIAYAQDPADPPLLTRDPIVGSPIAILGNASPQTGSARRVELNPGALWSSQIYVGGVQIGEPSDPNSPWLTGVVPEGTRMHSRWINFQRNLNTDGKVEIAGVGGCVFQIGLPTTGVAINNPKGASTLLSRMQTALRSAGVQGVQLRFSTYLTQRWASEEILAEIPELAECLELSSRRETSPGAYVNELITCQYDKLLKLWNQTPSMSKKKNRAIARVVGTVGIWDKGEPSTVPWQRYLPAVIDPRLVNANTGYAPNPLGCANARIDGGARVLSLDLGNTVPETDSAGQKYDLGELRVGIESGGERFEIGSLKPSAYAAAAYERTAGIVDMAIPTGVPLEGRLVLEAQEKRLYRGSSSMRFVAALAESADQLVVQTDQRGVYVEQGETGVINFDVLYNGPAPRRRTVHVTIAQYLRVSAPPGADGGAWQLVGSTLPGQTEPRAPAAYFPTPGGSSQVLTVQVALDDTGYGRGSFSFAPIEPGFPTYVFFPYLDSNPAPKLPEQIGPVAPGLTTLNAFYACARIMPFDDDLPAKFAECWNRTHSEDAAYEFVDRHIFAAYALIYPIMAGLVGSKQKLIDNNSGIQERTSAALRDNSAYLPITRELSAGKRAVIAMWGQLVDKGFTPSFDFPGDPQGATRTAPTSCVEL